MSQIAAPSSPRKRGSSKSALAALVLLIAACGGGGGGGGGSDTSEVSVGEAIARDSDGVAQRLGETVTTEGVVTVSAGVFANMKLKVFVQDGADGIMVYHQSAGDVDAFRAGDRLRATGVIRQRDPVPDNNPASGTVLIDLTGGSWTVLAAGEALPAPEPVTMAELAARGDRYSGSLVRIAGARKVSGDWPGLGSRSTEVSASDDGGATVLTLRLQRNTIGAELVGKLDVIGEDGAFDLTAIVVQDDMTDDGRLFDGYELWPRGTADIEPAG
jgi:hypothetical protein